MMPAVYQSGVGIESNNSRVPTIAVQQPSLPMAGMSGMNPNELEAHAHLEQQTYQNTFNGYSTTTNNNEEDADTQDYDDYDEENFCGATPAHHPTSSFNRAATLNYGTGGGGHIASSSFRM